MEPKGDEWTKGLPSQNLHERAVAKYIISFNSHNNSIESSSPTEKK